MKTLQSVLFLLTFCALSFRCMRDFSVLPIETPVRELTQIEKQLVESNNAFGLTLFRETVRQEEQKNIFLSPLSVAMALGMAYNGASGSTEEAMRNTLEFGNLTTQEINESFKSTMALLSDLDPNVRFQIANSIWYRLGFDVRQDFIDVNRTYFDAEVRGLDFSSPDAVNIINRWVDENTHGKIKEIIDAIDPFAVMFLMNAIYFKGDWTFQFDKKLTTDDWFYKPDGSPVSCRMMTQEGSFHYFETDDFQAIDLPYGDGKFSMTVFLPKAGKSLDAWISQLTPENWAEWIGSFSKKNLTLFLPKFRLEYEITLNDVLTALGMGIAFDPNQADFSRINNEVDLYINKVKHKTFVEVDEEGTESAAVTSVEIWITSAGEVMRVDRPFVFVIREHHSNAILFVGKIVEPSS